MTGTGLLKLAAAWKDVVDSFLLYLTIFVCQTLYLRMKPSMFGCRCQLVYSFLRHVFVKHSLYTFYENKVESSQCLITAQLCVRRELLQTDGGSADWSSGFRHQRETLKRLSGSSQSNLKRLKDYWVCWFLTVCEKPILLDGVNPSWKYHTDGNMPLLPCRLSSACREGSPDPLPRGRRQGG